MVFITYEIDNNLKKHAKQHNKIEAIIENIIIVKWGCLNILK